MTFTNDGTAATSSCVPKQAANLNKREAGDLDRYLDATRSTLLYARKVMLVEGPAELFLIPVLIKQVMNIDLDSCGISVVPIYGTHFEVYAKLFGEDALRKKCVIVCDGDMDADDIPNGLAEDDFVPDHSLNVDEDDLLQVYQCPVTFERAATLPGTLKMFLAAIKECSYRTTASELSSGIKRLKNDDLDEKRKEPASVQA